MTNTTTASTNANQDILDKLADLDRRLSKHERKQAPNSYQGWTNYETWVVSLWMDNDAKQYLRMRAFAEKQLIQAQGDKDMAATSFAETLTGEIENNVPSSLKGVYQELLQGALSQVNYFEIARTWLADIDLPQPPEPVPASIAPDDGKQKAGKYDLQASAEVMAVLSKAVIDEEGITLPEEQLERKLYEDVDLFLTLAGAKWHKGKRRHLFKHGKSRERILRLLESGTMLNEKKLFQAFYTPATVALELIALADIEPGMTCLEPSAGAGAIAQAAPDVGALVTCVEANPEACQELTVHGFAPTQADFLAVNTDELGRFDRILMNPPFTADQDIKHVSHAFGFLKPGGKLLAIMSPGFTFGGNKVRTGFRDFLAERGRIIKELEAGTFAESGTGVKTVIVELKKSEERTIEQAELFTAA